MHIKKMIAPILISVFLLLYYIGFTIGCISIPGIPWQLKLVLGLIHLVFVGITIYVLVERIKEIRSGEEDDLSKY